MIRLYHFLFFCFYSLVPEKNIYGRQNVAMILMSMVESYIILLAATAYDVFIYKFLHSGFRVFLLGAIVVVITFYLTIKYFEKEGRFESIKSEFKKEKVIYKMIAIAIFLLVILSFANGLQYLSIENRSRMLNTENKQYK
jgi:hypothetical protein